MNNKIKNAATTPLRDKSYSDSKLMAPDTKRVITKIVITHRTVFLLSRFEEVESAFPTVILLFLK